jgi:hypothetical protein
MAGKKMRKMEAGDKGWIAGAKLKSWVLVILGLLGLLQATGYIDLRQYYFAYVWSIIVLLIGLKKLWWLQKET